MDRLNKDCLISIFKHLDLQSRLQASKTCKLWRELLQNSEALLDGVSEVSLDGTDFPKDIDDVSLEDSDEIPEWNAKHALAAVLTHIQKSDQLTLPTDAASILEEEPIRECLSGFGKIKFVWNKGLADEDEMRCLWSSPITITNLSLNACITDFMFFDISGFDHLESLEIDFRSNSEPVFPQCRLPSTLRAFAINWTPPNSKNKLASEMGRVMSVMRLDQIIDNWPLLEYWRIGGVMFHDNLLNRFWRRLPNLARIHFHNVAFKYYFDSPGPDKLPIQWIKFENCTKDWHEAAKYLIKASHVKTVVITLKDESDADEVQKVYDLTPLIDSKKATLELTINSINQPRDLEDLLVPTELSRVLTKLELHSVHHSHLLQSIFISDQFEKLKEMKLHNCIELGDIDLAVVAEWCLNLEKISFKPHRCLGLHVITDQCLKPFITFWNNRKSKKLSIECLKTDLAFGWFQGPPDQEKGVFEDGKRWMQFRNSVLAGKKPDGSVRVGKRMVILDQNGKKMVIRDYDKEIRKKLKITVEDGGCRVKEVMNPLRC